MIKLPAFRHRLVIAGLGLTALMLSALRADGPTWWANRGVLNTSSPQDYAPLTQGQLKNMAFGAMQEMNADLPGHASPAIQAMVNGWLSNTTNARDYSAATLGQLKAVSAPFYDQLITLGLATQYPWTGSTTPASDFSIATVGQLKNVFNFNLNSTDIDGDGLSNVDESAYGTNPQSIDTDFDGNGDAEEVNDGTSPTDINSFTAKKTGYFPLDTSDWKSSDGSIPLAAQTGDDPVQQVTGWQGNGFQTNGGKSRLVYDWRTASNTPGATIVRGTARFWFEPNWSPSGPGINGAILSVSVGADSIAVASSSASGGSLTFTRILDGQTQTLSAPYILPDNAWHEVVVTYTEAGAAFFVDGGMIGQTSFNPIFPVTQSTAMSRIIFGAPDSGPELKGILDEVEFFNYALSSEDIQAQYAASQASRYVQINSSTSVSGVIGVPFSYRITATGNPTAYTVSGLPSWLTFDPASAIVSGTPTTTGAFTFTVNAVNATGYSSVTVHLVVLSNNTTFPGAPVITAPAQLNATVGTAFSYSIVASGSPAAYDVQNLPQGLSVNPATGVISGTPLVSGTFSLLLSASSGDVAGVASVPLIVALGAPVITSPLTASAVSGASFYYQIAGSNVPTTFTASSLPAGLTVDPSTGEIYGVPTVSGIFHVPINATNSSVGLTASATLVIAIDTAHPVIESSGVETLNIGDPFLYQTIAINNPTSYSASGLPEGLRIETTTGNITGQVETAGTYPITLTATNAAGSGSKTLTLTVTNAPGAVPTLTSPWLVYALTGQPFSYALTANGAGNTYSVSGLPTGFSFNSSTHIISATPTTSGVFQMTLNVSNTSGSFSTPLVVLVGSSSYSAVTATCDFQTGGAPSLTYSTTCATIDHDLTAPAVDTLDVPGIFVGNSNPSAGATERGLIGFDISELPPDAALTSASLTLHQVGNGTNYAYYTAPIVSFSVYQLSHHFYEGSSSWNFDNATQPNPLSTQTFTLGDDAVTWASTANFASAVQAAIPSHQLDLAVANLDYEADPYNETDYRSTQFFGENPDSVPGYSYDPAYSPKLSVAYATKYPPYLLPGQTAIFGVGRSDSYRVKSVNGPQNLSGAYSATGLPAGLSINSATGVISGTPTSVFGATTVTVTVTNGHDTYSTPMQVATAVLDFTLNTYDLLSVTLPSFGDSAYSVVPIYEYGFGNETTVNPTATLDTNFAGEYGFTFEVCTSGKFTAYAPINYSITDTPISELRLSDANFYTDSKEHFEFTLPAPSASGVTYHVSGLPSWVTFDPETHEISGTPPASAVGTVTFQEWVSDSSATGNPATITIEVSPLVLPQFSAQTLSIPAGDFYTNLIYDEGHYYYYPDATYSATNMPSWMSIDSGGYFYGNAPAHFNDFTISLTVSTPNGSFTGPITFTQDTSQSPHDYSLTNQVNVPMNTDLNLTSASSVTATGLPAGLSVAMDPDNGYDWAVQGTPTALGTYTGTFSIVESYGTLTVNFTLKVTPAPAITPNLNPRATVGVPFTYTVATSTPLTAFTASNLPDGLTMSSAGVISGTPTVADCRDVPISALFGSTTVTGDTVLSVVPRTTDYSIDLQGNSLPTTSYQVPVAAIESDTAHVNASENTVLPAPGLLLVGKTSPTLSKRGLLAFDLSSLPPDATITGANLFLLQTDGGVPQTEIHECADPFTSASATWIANSTYLASALSFQKTPAVGSVRNFSGTTAFASALQTARSGSGTIYLTIVSPSAESGGTAQSITFLGSATLQPGNPSSPALLNPKLTVYYTLAPPTQAPSITSPSLATGLIGAAFGYTISATGHPAQFTASGLPPGLSLNATTGVISGTPTQVGSSVVTVGATNALGTGTKSITINIDSATQADTLTKTGGDTQVGVFNTFLASPLQVHVSVGSTALANTLVTFAIADQGNEGLSISNAANAVTASSLVVKTDSSGNASAYLKLPPGVGPVSIRATAGTATPVTFQETSATTANTNVDNGSVILTIISGAGQTGAPGTVLAPMVIQATNSLGLPLPNITVQFTPGIGGGTISSSASGPFLSSLSLTTNSLGQITLYLKTGANTGLPNIVNGTVTLGGFGTVTSSATVTTDGGTNATPTPGGAGLPGMEPMPNPMIVKDLKATAISDDTPDQITLSWQTEGSGIGGYVIEKKVSTGKWFTWQTTSSTTTSDSGLSAGVRYQYRVRGVRQINGQNQYSAPSNTGAYYYDAIKGIKTQYKFWEAVDTDHDHIDGDENGTYSSAGDPNVEWGDSGFGDYVARRGGDSGGMGQEGEMAMGHYKFELYASNTETEKWLIVGPNNKIEETDSWSGGGTETSVFSYNPPDVPSLDGKDSGGNYNPYEFDIIPYPVLNACDAGTNYPLDDQEKQQTGAIVDHGMNGYATFSVSVPGIFGGAYYTLSFGGPFKVADDKTLAEVGSGASFYKSDGTFRVIDNHAHYGDTMTVTFTAYTSDGKTIGTDSSLFVYKPDSSYTMPIDDAAGPEYRKIALNGAPLADRKPQQKEETDQEPEETYVDALTLQLRHSTTDIYIPIPGSDFSLSARRDLTSEVWNMRNGLRPSERPDRPFGVCWVSNLAPNIHIVTTQALPVDGQPPDRSQFPEPDKVYVTDETGAVYTFYTWYNQGGGAEFFPMPNSKNEQAANLASLSLDMTTSPHTYRFKKKYGTRLNFQVCDYQPFPVDRQVGSDTIEIDEFARMISAVDRYGNKLDYSFSGASLVPNTIRVEGRPGVISILQDDSGKVETIWDANGNATSFSYTSQSYNDDSQLTELTQVTLPDNSHVNYHYEIEQEMDQTLDQAPYVPYDNPTPSWHCDLTSIQNEKGNTYQFQYQDDHSKLNYIYIPEMVKGYYPVTGLPRTVKQVTLPGSFGITTFTNNSKVWVAYADDGETFTYEGHRDISVTDANSKSRNYHFGLPLVLPLPKFAEEYESDHMADPKIICYDRMTIDYGTLGYEQFDFDPSASMALSRTRDLSGNVTTFAHADAWSDPGDYFTIMTNVTFNGFYGDPTSQTNALGDTKSFTYTTSRLMSSVTDEAGQKTVYGFDNKGRRISESIYAAGGTSPEQETDFAYESTYPDFVTTQTVRQLSSAFPGARDLVTSYVPDGGQVGQQIVDPYGLRLATTYTYDNNGNKLSERDPRGNTTWFSYDHRNRLGTITHPDGGQQNFQYDVAGNKTAEYDEDGDATLYQYDELNRVQKQARDMNSNGTIDTVDYGALATSAPDPHADLVTQFTYNNVNSKLTETDPRGKQTTYTYDDIQRMQTMTDARNKLTQYFYDGPNFGSSCFATSDFKPTSVKDPRLFVTTFTYDGLYHLKSKSTVYDPAKPPSVTSTEYDKVGNAVLNTDAAGNQTHVYYDALNRPVYTLYGDYTASSANYSSTGLKWQETDERGNATETLFDGAGRPTDVLEPTVNDGTGASRRPKATTYYDAAGNTLATLDPLGNRTDFTYDACNRKVAEFQPTVWDAENNTNGRPTLRWTYDAVGNEIASQDARGNLTTKQYDANNRLTDLYQPTVPIAGTRTAARPHIHTTYDYAGNPLTVLDPNSHLTTNTYDDMNHLQTTLDAENNLVTYGYDDSGNRTDVWDGLSQHTGFGYDGLNRNISITDAATHAVTFSYDGLNKRGRSDSLTRQTSYDYDARNRLKTVTYSGADGTVNYQRDAVGNVLSVTEPAKGGLADVSYTYDALNRQTSETSGGFTHNYLYDLNGNRVFTTFGGTGRIIKSQYDALNRLLLMTENPASSNRVTSYEYDRSGNIFRKILPNGDHIVTTHDALNRSTQFTGTTLALSSLYSYGYGYDLAGNLRKVSESYPSGGIDSRTLSMDYDGANRLLDEIASTSSSTITTAYTYDAANNRATRTITGGSSAGTTTYHCNSLNELTSTTGAEANSYGYDFNGNRTARNPGNGDATYTYDFENRLIEATDSSAGDHTWDYVYDYRSRRVAITEHDGTASATTKIVFSGGTSVQEYSVAGTTNTLNVEYVRGSDMGGGVGGILYTLRGTTPSFTHADSRGDIVAKTSGTGSLTYQAAYQAFGKRTEESGSTLDRQKANSKDEDPTGFLNEGMRYRDLATGEFITRDPAGFVDGPNLYTYVVQNPWTKFDPEGLFVWGFAVEAGFALYDTYDYVTAQSPVEKSLAAANLAIDAAGAGTDIFDGGAGGGVAEMAVAKGVLKASSKAAMKGATAVAVVHGGELAVKQLPDTNNSTNNSSGGGSSGSNAQPPVKTAQTTSTSAASTAKMTPQQQRAVSKINNAVDDHLKPMDISGAVADQIGSPIPRLGGGLWDHTKEVIDAMRGVRKNTGILENVDHPAAEAARQKGADATQRVNDALQGAGI